MAFATECRIDLRYSEAAGDRPRTGHRITVVMPDAAVP